MPDDNALLGRLIGARMHSVEFVLDYVQLHFEIPAGGPSSVLTDDQPVLACFVLPSVEIEGTRFFAESTGWTDALVALAGRTVVSVRESDADGVRLDFAEASLALQPLESELVGPEIATLQGFADKQWAYWAPGLPPFGHLS